MDEIDAIGSKRYDSSSGGTKEIQRTMIELLTQLDGFDERSELPRATYTHLCQFLEGACGGVYFDRCANCASRFEHPPISPALPLHTWWLGKQRCPLFTPPPFVHTAATAALCSHVSLLR